MPSNSACFNSQPPEGGWYSDDGAPIEVVAFQLTAARRRLGDRNRAASQVQVFQLTAARRRLATGNARDWTTEKFQLTAARRRLGLKGVSSRMIRQFQLTAARRRLDNWWAGFFSSNCFNSQPPEGGWLDNIEQTKTEIVSTHSRPKAAGNCSKIKRIALHSFNSQPPEGGWVRVKVSTCTIKSFNSQPPEGGW